MCLLTSYYRCFFHIPLSTFKPPSVDAAPESDRQINISFDTKVCCSWAEFFMPWLKIIQTFHVIVA